MAEHTAVVRLGGLRTYSGKVPPSPSVQLLAGLLVGPNTRDGGRGRITATVKIDGDPIDAPVRRLVRLYDVRSGLLVRQTWSDAVTGVYDFQGLDASKNYYLTALDHAGVFAAIATGPVAPTVMP